MKVRLGIYEIDLGLLHTELKEEYWGRSNMADQWMRVAPGMTRERAMETLIHEVLHLSLGRGGWKELDSDEKLIRHLAEDLAGFCLGNRPLLEAFLDGRYEALLCGASWPSPPA